MINVYRIANKHGDEIIDYHSIEALKRLHAVTFKGTTRVKGATVYHYTVRSA